MALEQQRGPKRDDRSKRDGRPRRKGRRDKREQREFDQVLLDVARVTRVVAGGRRFRFRAAVAIGNKKGRVGFGVAKGPDVTIAVSKAVHQAKRDMIDVPVVRGTIPHDIVVKVGSARLTMRPARKGAGIIAGGPVRAFCELAGIKDVVAKIYGTNNKINNSHAVLKAFQRLEGKRAIMKRRGIAMPDKKVATNEKKAPAATPTVEKKVASAPVK